ncbi:MAG: hypothetical protein ACK4K0_08755 [Flavobacteriales bacterium]
MNDVLDILKYIIPALIVFGICYYLLKMFFDKEQAKVDNEWKLEVKKKAFPLKLQAYERLVLYLERINPSNLVMRVHEPGMSAKMLHKELLKTIRDEYEHNMTQQLYVSVKGWNLFKQSKEETIKIYNLSFGKVADDASGIDMAEKVFEIVSKLDKTPSDIASEYLKKEIQAEM